MKHGRGHARHVTVCDSLWGPIAVAGIVIVVVAGPSHLLARAASRDSPRKRMAGVVALTLAAMAIVAYFALVAFAPVLLLGALLFAPTLVAAALTLWRPTPNLVRAARLVTAATLALLVLAAGLAAADASNNAPC